MPSSFSGICRLFSWLAKFVQYGDICAIFLRFNESFLAWEWFAVLGSLALFGFPVLLAALFLVTDFAVLVTVHNPVSEMAYFDEAATLL